MPAGFPIMCMAGMPHIEAVVAQRARSSCIPFDEAFAAMPKDDLLQAALEGMPAFAREAFLNGRRAIAQRQTQLTTRAAVQELKPKETSMTTGSTLSPTDYNSAQSIFAQIAAPLTADELSVCAKVGITPEAFKAERDRELNAKLPGGAYALTDSEREVCQKLGISEPDYAAEKKRLAGA